VTLLNNCFRFWGQVLLPFLSGLVMDNELVLGSSVVPPEEAVSLASCQEEGVAFSFLKKIKVYTKNINI